MSLSQSAEKEEESRDQVLCVAGMHNNPRYLCKHWPGSSCLGFILRLAVHSSPRVNHNMEISSEFESHCHKVEVTCTCTPPIPACGVCTMWAYDSTVSGGEEPAIHSSDLTTI